MFLKEIEDLSQLIAYSAEERLLTQYVYPEYPNRCRVPEERDFEICEGQTSKIVEKTIHCNYTSIAPEDFLTVKGR